MNKILITGAGSGLGKELALLYSKNNNHLILIGKTKKKLMQVKEYIVEFGGSADCYVCDIADINSIDDIFISIKNKFNSIDSLINCAGIGFFGPFDSINSNEIDTMIDVNIRGTIMMTKLFLPITNKKLINIISTAGLKGKANEAVYVASKFAIRGFTESLQKEYENDKLDITAVYMGGMNTPFWDNNNHIKDKSRLKSAKDVAKIIINCDDGRKEIII